MSTVDDLLRKHTETAMYLAAIVEQLRHMNEGISQVLTLATTRLDALEQRIAALEAKPGKDS